MIAETLVEFVRRFHGVLPGHRVGDEQNLGGRELVFQLRQLRHQLFVDMQAARSVDQENVAARLHRFFARAASEFGRLGFLGRAFVDRES